MQNRRKRAETIIRTQNDRLPHLFVGGLEVESEGSSTTPIVNPANQEPLGRCPQGNKRDVEKAVSAAQRAFADEWSRTTPEERAKLVWHLADQIELEIEDLAILESLQTGKTFREVLDQDLRAGVRALRYYAGWSGKLGGESHHLGDGLLGYVERRPHRVAGVVAPASEPIGATLRKIAPAIAMGATVVVNPPERAPLTVLRLGEIVRDLGFPPGVINVVTGTPVAEALANSPDVDALLFTGTIEAARRMLLGSAKSNLKPVYSELGGKSAMLVFEDADVRAAVRAAWISIFTSRCVRNTAGARMLIHESLYEETAHTLAARAKEIVLGDPLDEHTELGPMIDEEQMKRVLAYVELGRRENAKLVAGGGRAVAAGKADGWFVEPTLFVDVKPSMRIAREEIGGPMLSMIPFSREEEAIHVANDTDYGMTAAVFTSDLTRAHRVAGHLRAGVVWVNHYDAGAPSLARGGVALSGNARDLGREALGQYTCTKSVYVPTR
jgi:acyl-CoA reductase-like NAD-dependent aldehyde dehydrogenase